MTSHVRLERRGSAAWIILNRPDDLNAMGEQLVRELRIILDDVEGDAEIRCLVFTGAGRAFCAGADLKFLQDLPVEQQASATSRFLQDATDLMSRIECFPKPVIAAVNGVATAGGMELVLACDLVIAAEGAKLGDGHANFGLLPGAGGSMRLPRRIGAAHAKYLFFTGDLLPAGDHMFAGLVNMVVPNSELSSAVDAVVNKVSAKSPIGLMRMKELANASADITLADGLAREQDVNESYMLTYDRNEGLAAFSEKRRPAFLGR